METQTTMAMAAAELRGTGFVALVNRAFKQPQQILEKENTIESVICYHFSTMSAVNHTWKRETFRSILLHLYSEGCYTLLKSPDFIEVLANMSAFGKMMVRSVDSWKKESFVAEDQLRSFIKHCFTNYDVPQFMENAFGGENKVHMLWYIQLGRGDSVQKLSGFPVEFTKRMAHEFRNIKRALTIPRAIRMAQTLGFGATNERAELIAWSALSEGFDNEAFRTELVKFFAIAEGDIRLDLFQITIDYLFYMKAENNAFTMKGRTWDVLYVQALGWHRDMLKKKAAESNNQWKPADVGNFCMEEDEARFVITQLTSSEALYDEGEEMEHCVADYVYQCSVGESAIFSLRKFTGSNDFYETLATIEVLPSEKEIVQAQAKYNDMISQEAHDVIVKWAQQEGIVFNLDSYDAEPEPIPQPLPQVQQQVLVVQPREQQRPVENYEPYKPFNPYRGVNFSIEGVETRYIIFFIIKMVLLMAKCSQIY
ncbi:PcfJ domain-containing protein [Flavobacterium beibuense]|uniref:PcfJ domain-containing protein n=1 Tax=Flavobacterium beibuense TaxID=657326 RepID=UPI003A8DD004